MGHEPNKPAGAQRSKRLPTSQILAFTFTNLAQGVMLTMPFTVAVFMVRGFLGGSGDEAQIGRLTGLLAAAYSLSQFTTSYAWGIFSSRFGRKPVMVIGSAASTVTLLWFGLSERFSTAVASRVVAGLLNGIIVAWKCSLGDSCDALEQGRVLSYMSLSWGIGCILGPSIGGMASMPCTTWGNRLPGCSTGGLLYNRPYFLACAISALVNAVALCLNVFVLRESLPQLVAARNRATAAHQHSAPSSKAAAAADAADTGSDNSCSSSREGITTLAHDKDQQAYTTNTLQHMLQSVAAQVRAASNRLQQLFGRKSVQYERISSSLVAPSSSSSSSSPCGPGCTGCHLCWALWRAESGLGEQVDQQHQQQHHDTQHSAPAHRLHHEDSAVNLQLAVLQRGAASQLPPAAEPAGSKGSSLGGQLRPNDSVSERTIRCCLPAKQKDVEGLEQHCQQHLGQEQAQHCLQQPAQQQCCTQHCALSSAPDMTPLQQAHGRTVVSDCVGGSTTDAAPDSSMHHVQATDCTILVANQQHSSNPDAIQHDPPAACDLDPLLPKSPNRAVRSAQPPGPLPWYKQRQVVLVLLAYGTVCLLFCAIDELTPIFASAPLQQGGLQMSEIELAGPLAFSGACLIVVALLVFPAAQRVWGTLTVTRCGLLIALVVAFAIPCTSFDVHHGSSNQASGAAGIGVLGWGLLYFAMLLKAFAGCFAFTGTMIVVNTSVTDQQQLGQVNGVGQSLASLARGVGPAVGGLLWGTTVHLQGHVAGAQLLPFACVASTAVVALLLYVPVQPTDGIEAQLPSHGSSCCQE